MNLEGPAKLLDFKAEMLENEGEFFHDESVYEEKEFCEIESALYLPLIVNEYVSCFIQEYIMDIEMDVCIDLVRNFCNFLFINDHTYLRINMIYGTVSVPEFSIKQT